MHKKTLFATEALLILGLLSLLLTACGSPSGSAAKQILNMPNIGTQDIKTMDPATVTDLNSAQAIELAFSGLVSLDPKTLQVIPDIATSWDVSNGGKTYTFHLQSGVKFSNGDAVDADTFAYSIDRALDPATKSNIATLYLGHIIGANDRNAGKIPTIIGNGVKAVDPLTLQINLDSPIGFFLQTMTYPTSWAVDKNVVQQYGANWWEDHAVGTGPFILQKWQHKIQLTFVQNPNWYGKKLTLTEVDMPMIADTDTAFKRFQAKQADVDNGVDSANYPIAKALGSSQFFEGPALSIGYLSPNSAVAPFDNLTVRQAFAEAVDRDTIANQLLRGFVLPSDHIVPQGMPGYNANLKGLSFDPKDAKDKLTSVYPDVSKMPAVTLEYPKVADNDKVAAKLQQDFQTYLGVHINLNAVDFEQLIPDVYTNKVQFYFLGWIADYPDPQDWTSLQFVKGSPNNTMNFENPQVDQLVAQADVEQDQAMRISLYNQAEELAVDGVAWIPISQGKNVYTFQTYVKGFVQDAGGLTPDNVWPNISIAAH
ncbi:MAG TPA: peptide ABC transporter substrate-binding protein [Ktedonobacterales bacterium]|jgi:peptide/nickel transport system substrate-binding protein/oligopeptide transport system substrate-binding protein